MVQCLNHRLGGWWVIYLCTYWDLCIANGRRRIALCNCVGMITRNMRYADEILLYGLVEDIYELLLHFYFEIVVVSTELEVKLLRFPHSDGVSVAIHVDAL